MTWVHRAVLAGFGFGVGASIGSFLNVCVWRLPRGESLIHPPSRCPLSLRGSPCAKRAGFGWLWLRGRCRRCAPIARGDVLVETAAGLLFALALSRPDPLDGNPLVNFACFLPLGAISSLLTTSLMAHDRRSHPEQRVVRSDPALFCRLARLALALAIRRDRRHPRFTSRR